MTDGLDQALANAAVTLLQADAGLTVFRGGVPNPTPSPPYVVVRTAPPDRPSDDPDNSMDGKSGVWVTHIYCYCVGGGGGTPADAEVAAIAVAQRVRTQLLDARVTIAGLSCGPIRWDQSLPPRRSDEITGVPIVEAVEIYRLRATS